MLDLVATLSISAAASGVAYLSKGLIDQIFDKHTKEVAVQDKHGRKRFFKVDVDASQEVIINKYKNEIDFENYVYKILNSYSKQNSEFKFEIGKYVDFIGEYNGQKIAIEAKSSDRKIDKKAIKEYMKDSPDLEGLIFILNYIPNEHVLTFLQGLPDKKKIKLLYSPKKKKLKSSILSTMNQILYNGTFLPNGRVESLNEGK